MEALDTTILNTAVPAIAGALGVQPLSMKAVLASYTLSLAVFIPVSGWMANRFGTRRVFATAIGIFTVGSFFCGVCRDIHWLVACRILQGCGGAMLLPVGRLTMIRTFAKSELVRATTFVAIPGLIGPLVGPMVGGLIVGYFHWSVIFFVNIPIGLCGLYLAHRHMPNYSEDRQVPLDTVGMVLFGSGIALLSYVLEVFGEHTLSAREILGLLVMSGALLSAYGLNTSRITDPLLNLGLLLVRSFRVAVGGNLFTRLGIGGVPFLLPLLYQVGLGFSAIQSGLLIMPQAFAAMSLKIAMPKILARFGYRRVLIANTLSLGVGILSFSLIGVGTPIAVIVLLAFLFGFLASLQYTSMNTLAYADIDDEQASAAATIASTVQQLSISLGIATASLITEVFVGNRMHASAAQMIHGIHLTFLLLGGLTVLSTLTFVALKNEDGASISRHRNEIP